ncbi:MAG: right-handed parallel beta-helix repeat-containing protein [Saprospiraceae bacterium]|nr:T9SS type A sorting domain-containing protein [Candidatus Brachybacter algidus]MBK8749827.1 right-handed parallel beta-helix repeat-containing protein [Candidatus Brachybacter algidus]
MKFLFSLILALLFSASLSAITLHVGPGQPYNSLSDAAQDALPGDTILFHSGTYPGGEFVNELQGTNTQWIYIRAESASSVVIQGGTNSWQLSDAAYLKIEGFVFEQQTGNGFNMDDGGSYDTPSHHITFERCIFRDINASGNNDLLKMSGVNDFLINHCDFINGSAGGSGVDMVGCHRGIIEQNLFENLGSNAIQAKGGTQYLTIQRNFFKNCGQRSLNLGGSTGLEFFRPIDATFEAADIQVFSNIFIGSVAPIAFVGCVRVEVINNTIVSPEKWVMRILQETVDPDRFELCGNNSFRNNIIYKSNAVSTDCNIGPNTAPETFLMSNNLWYNYENTGNSAPNAIPVTDENNIIGSNPEFANVVLEAFTLLENSPAIATGFNSMLPVIDYYGVNYAGLRSIGASEGKPDLSKANRIINDIGLKAFPNPFQDEIMITWDGDYSNKLDFDIIDIYGRTIRKFNIENGNFIKLDIEIPGNYFLKLKDKIRLVDILKIQKF